MIPPGAEPALAPSGAPGIPVLPPDAAQDGQAPPTAGTPAATFDLASLPSIDSLTAATDIRAFLRKEVPEALRRAALRKAWSLDPAIRDFVGPADYAWDYNAPDGVPGASLDLVGDVREMLAQIFGPDTPAKDAPAEDAATAQEPPELAAVPELQAQPSAGAAAPEAPSVALAPTPDDPGVPTATPPEAARRHGSALPS